MIQSIGHIQAKWFPGLYECVTKLGKCHQGIGSTTLPLEDLLLLQQILTSLGHCVLELITFLAMAVTHVSQDTATKVQQ